MKSFTSLRALALLGAGMALVPATAFAQDAEGEDELQTENVIIVTAQGRQQALADVPVAISAINSETLVNSGANDIRQLNQVAPSLLVSSTGSEANGSARIRGIGTVGDNPGLESSVPVFIDGVYRSRSGIGLNELGEIDRVEVQRGPQGTLGGRNSSAGLISIFSKKPDFDFGATGEFTYGNYNFFRLGGSITGPITENLAARLDGIYVKRDGFYTDPANNTDINDRDRVFVRGQLLFEPTEDLSIRLIADYTYRDEKCCTATYVDSSVNPFIGNLNNPSNPLTPLQTNGNNIINVLRDLGQNIGAFNQGYDRTVSITRGRSYAGITKDAGISAQVDWDLGGATLTSITAYREYRSGQGSDTDYGTVDILYRAQSDQAYRQFHTFTQELRLQGEAFDGKLDWLVGGFFANEDLVARDNLRFGTQYGRFANCRIISGGGFAGLYSPTNPLCVTPGVGPATIAGAVGGGQTGADIVAGFTALDGLNDRGTIIDDYRQDGTNWALFTHNIVDLTDRLALTLGLRYTNDKKDFSALFGNNNTVCTTVQGLLLDDLSSTNATARALAGSLIGLSCQGNSTAELNGVAISDDRREDEWTGTAILSWKATDDLLFYTSFARGYKAGGFNLDRSALKSPIFPFGGQAGAQALVGNLQFDPELVDSYEFGIKYASRPFSLSVAAFRSDFSNFQLNTFNGTVFLVQTINGCKGDLVGGPSADSDTSATTGACAASDVSYGVRTQGVEIETMINPFADFSIAGGVTYARTRYVDDLVGSSAGAPLDPALRKLPGDNLSNAPEWVATGSVTWTPAIGSGGLSGLVYFDGRYTEGFNTGSDLFPQKEQESFALFNARIGIRGPDLKWSLELWGQNIFNKDYAQIAFNSPFQSGTTAAPFTDPQYPGGRQLFSQFLAEPRVYGVTGRFNF
jgi:outer membrane receptor protein involved in Fe transport